MESWVSPMGAQLDGYNEDGEADYQGFVPAVSLWERESQGKKCPEDRLIVISATYGDKVVTGALLHKYNTGERIFAAN